MIFLVLGITVTLLVYLTIVTKHKDKGGYLLAFGILIFSVIVFTVVGVVVNNFYYTYGNHEIEDNIVELHPVSLDTLITLDDYIKHEPKYVLDVDYNLIKLDFDEIEVIITDEEPALIRREIAPKGLWKMIVFEPSRTVYVLKIYDWRYAVE